MKLSKITAAIIVATLSNTSQAETVLNDIYVTDNSSILNDNLKTTYATQVFTKEDISASGATDLTGFLTQNTSLQIQPQYGNPMAAQIDMNGYGLEAGNSNVQIIVDGVSLNSIDSAPVILNFIGLNSIAEIAILRGSGSVLYGNGATAGAIVITTVDGYTLPDHAKISVQLGSHSTSKHAIALHKGGKINNYKAFIDLNADLYHTDGSIEVQSQNKKNESNSDNVALKLGLNNDKTSYMASVSRSSGDTIYANPIPIADFKAKADQSRTGGTSQEFENKRLGLSVNHKLTDDSKVNYQISHEDRNSAYSGSPASEFKQTEHQLDFKTRFESAVLTYGGSLKSAKRDGADFSGTAHKTTRDDHALFASADIELSDDVLLNAGYRRQHFDYEYKDPSQNSKEKYNLSSYNLGASLLLNQSSSVFANFNHAFNAPNIDWLFNYDGSFNGLISPMKTDTLTVGYKYKNDNTNFSAEVFKAKLKDEMFYNPSLGFFGENTNIDSSSKKGINLSVKQSIQNAVIGADYSYVDAKVNKVQTVSYKGNRLPGVSDQTLKLFAEYNFSTDLISLLPEHGFRVTHKTSSSLYAISDFANTDGLNSGYTSTDISYKMANKRTALQFGINNLFNQENGLYVYSNFSNATSVYTTNYERTFYVRADLTF